MTRLFPEFDLDPSLPDYGLLEQAFFPVHLHPLYFSDEQLEDNENRTMERPVRGLLHYSPRWQAVVDDERTYMFTAASSGYCLIRNFDAYWFAVKDLARILFHTHGYPEELRCKKMYLSKDRAICEMDLRRALEVYQPLINEGWYAFIRIVNSYNKSRTLRYIIGFGRGDCGVLIPGLSVELSEQHVGWNKEEIFEAIRRKAEAKYDKIKSIEEAFLAKIFALRQLHIAKEFMLFLYCRFFDIHIPADLTIEKRENLRDKCRLITSLINRYAHDYGETAYAMLNVFAEYISKQDGLSQQQLTSNQLALGEWADEYIEVANKPNFSFATYVGHGAIDTAYKLKEL